MQVAGRLYLGAASYSAVDIVAGLYAVVMLGKRFDVVGCGWWAMAWPGDRKSHRMAVVARPMATQGYRVISSVLLEDKDGDAGQHGADGEPCLDGAHRVVVVGGLSHLHLVGLNIDDVVLL